MIPLWLGDGMLETMVVIIFFGLLFGSVITLVVVPVSLRGQKTISTIRAR